MKALIFAAGLGTRLRPLTNSIPKALVPVGGIPMLQRILLKIKSAGINDIIVNAHHFSEKIVAFIEDNDGFGADVKVSVEKDEPLETGGGIRHAEHLLKGSGRFLVHNADILSNLSIEWLLAADRPESLATLVVHEAEADRYLLFDDGMRLVGWTNVRTGEVKSPYPDLKPAECRRYSFCGIHVISENVFPLMKDWPDKFGIIDFYLSVADRFPIVGVIPSSLKLIDIGSPEKLAEAEAAVWEIGKK